MMMIMIVMIMVIMRVVVIAVIVAMTVMMAGMIMAFSGCVRVALVRIGAALRIEWRLDLDRSGTQPLHHRLDHVIAPDAQAFRRDLRRQMSIAEMPCDANQVLRILAADFHQRLGRRNHFDQPAIIKHQCVTASQRDRMFQIEQEFEPARAGHRNATAVTIVEIEHHGIGRRLNPAMLSMYLRGADHD
jgi:hypothetical protein